MFMGFFFLFWPVLITLVLSGDGFVHKKKKQTEQAQIKMPSSTLQIHFVIKIG